LQKRYIPKSLYRQFSASMPICCVDLIIWHKGKILLLKRKNYPAKNKWWTPGGRVMKGERLKEAAMRIAQQELALQVKILRQVGTYEAFFRKGYFGNSCHCIGIVFLAIPISEEIKIKLDSQSLAHKWASALPKHLLRYFVEQPEAIKIRH